MSDQITDRQNKRAKVRKLAAIRSPVHPSTCLTVSLFGICLALTPACQTPGPGVSIAATPPQSHLLTADEARQRIIEWCDSGFHHLDDFERGAQMVEWTDNEIWNRLGVQVFVLNLQGFVVSSDGIAALGSSFGGMGLQSICVGDLNGDGRPMLLFTYSWGSGRHRSQVGAWSGRWTKPGTVDAGISYGNDDASWDLMLKRIGDREVEIVTGTTRVGKLRLQEAGKTPRLSVELDSQLPANVRSQIEFFER
jgi:hypothetical protein